MAYLDTHTSQEAVSSAAYLLVEGAEIYVNELVSVPSSYRSGRSHQIQQPPYTLTELVAQQATMPASAMSVPLVTPQLPDPKAFWPISLRAGPGDESNVQLGVAVAISSVRGGVGKVLSDSIRSKPCDALD